MSVTISYKKFGLIPVVTTWFNTAPTLNADELGMLHVFRQSAVELVLGRTVCIQQSVFNTTVIDLTQSEKEIWKAFDPKSCKYEIRKIQKMADKGEDVKIAENTDIARYIEIANSYIQVKKYLKPLRSWQLEKYMEKGCGDLINIYYNGQLVGGNFYIKDGLSRVRLLYSFNDRFSDETLRKLSGAFMRYLHWRTMIEMYKQQGFRWYDMGGINLDKDSPAYGITQFKQSFGGFLLKEFDYVLVANRFIGELYRLYKSILYRNLSQL